ncbi:MAG: nucleotide sugar dehydrogenase [Kiloniellaceae bacterium]
MKVSIFGMGYVGAVSGACFARLGHTVTGVDVNRGKIDTINSGGTPVVEEGLTELMAEAQASGRISATDDAVGAVLDSDISLISVGTPTGPDGKQSLGALDAVIAAIGEAVQKKTTPHSVVVRSTVMPGTTERRIAPALEKAAGRRLGDGLELCFNPEFLREGAAVKDFFTPPFTVIGSVGDAGSPGAEGLYAGIQAPLIGTSSSTAESLKYACNAYHAVKIAFANEMGALMKANGIDGRDAMRIFCEDRDLNISPAYLRPGFAFGGSCLPKELRAIADMAKDVNLSLPMLDHVLASNDRHIDRAFEMIQRRGRRKIALFGLAFKPGTDDLRESPLVTLAERLIGKGFELAIFDRSVDLARLTGTNLEYIEREIPHLDRLVSNSVEATLDGARTIVIGHAPKDAIPAIAAAANGCSVIDLQGVAELQQLSGADYEGICW